MLAWLGPALVEGEEVLVAAVAQPRATAGQVAAQGATAAVASLALSAASGLGVGVVVYRKPLWLVVTSRRVLLLEHEAAADREREIVFAASRDTVGATSRVRGNSLAEVTLIDRSNATAITRLNLGWNWRKAAAVSTAIDGDPAIR